MAVGISLKPDQKIRLVAVGDKEVDIAAKVSEIRYAYTSISFPYLDEKIYVALATKVPEGTPFTFTAGNTYGLFTFSCKYRSSALLPERLIYFDHPVIVDRTQQRDFIRIPFSADVSYSVVIGDVSQALGKSVTGKTVLKGDSFKKGKTINISAGGMLLRLPEKVEKGANIGIIVDLPGFDAFTIVAETMHCRVVDGEDDAYDVGVKFEEQIKNSSDNIKYSRALAVVQREWLHQNK